MFGLELLSLLVGLGVGAFLGVTFPVALRGIWKQMKDTASDVKEAVEDRVDGDKK